MKSFLFFRTSSIGRSWVLSLLMLLICSANALAQGITVKGVVRDGNGDGLPGVTVVVKGSNNGVISDIEGRYSIQAKTDDVLTFSYIGMITEDVKVAGRTVIDVTLKEDSETLDEVVVVGYGTQKKVSVTGSIVSMDAKKLENLPTDNVSNMLAGRLPGLVAVQSTGMPGEGASLLVRGSSSTSTKGNAPVFIVDGIQRDMIDTLNPDEIQNITILKDAASAAIYGVQGGSGVVLITTKRGMTNQKPTIQFKASMNLSENTNFPEFLNAMDYMTWHNRARELDGLTALYTPDIVNQVMTSQGVYGQTDWFGEVFSGKGLTQNYNVNLNGGSERLKYFVSAGYMDNEGIVKNISYNKINIRSNIDAKITDYLKMSVDLAGYKSETDKPSSDVSNGNSGSSTSIFWQATLSKPIFPLMYDGVYSVPTTLKGNMNPVAALTESGFNKQTTTQFNSSVRFDLDIPKVKGLSVHFLAAFDRSATRGKIWKLPYELAKGDITTGAINMIVNGVQQRSVLNEKHSETEKLAVQPSINYENNFGKHYLRAQVVYDQLQTKTRDFSAGKMNYELTDIPELSLGSDEEIVAGSVKGTSSKFARIGVVGRINYNYNEKYLIEALLRSDASVYFSEDNRWGYFPAVSVGWRLSEEGFMKDYADVINNLKIRGSWGITGNDRINAWQYLRTISLDKNAYVFGGKLVNGLKTGDVPYYDITWEKSRTYNVGLDATLWNGLLSIEFDYFYKYTWDILQGISTSVPPSIGGNVPKIMNSGKVDNRGFELVVGHNGNIGKDFTYNVSANVAYNDNRILQFNDAVNIPDHQKKTGHRIGSIIGLIADGLYKDEDDLANSPKFKGDAKVGDIKYRDMNGDGVIDLVNDMTIISDGAIPKYNYGLSLDAKYKWFDVSMLFQGAAGFEIALQGFFESGSQSTTNFTKPFAADGNTPYFLVENSWTPENTGAEFPRLTTRTAINQNAVSSSYWLRNGNYIRMKNLQIGCTLPRKIINRIGLENIRLYVSGTNLFTISKLNKYGLDPEAPSVNNGYYPQQRVYTFGINVTL